MKPTPIPLPSAGVDNRTTRTGLRAGSAREIENAVLRSSGAWARRDGYAPGVPGADFHSIHADEFGVLVVRGTQLCACALPGLTLSSLYDTGIAAAVDLTEHNGRAYVLTLRELLVRDAAGIRPAGVDAPHSLPALSSVGVGGLPAGAYGVAISALADDGEESGAVWVGIVSATGAISVAGLDSRAHRIYVTTADGDTLYRAIDTTPGQTSVQITYLPEGAACATLHMQRLPGGQLVRARAGRIYVAQGDVVAYSQPLRPHLFDPRADFLPMVGTVGLLEPVRGGVFVGDSRGVWFLGGDDPSSAAFNRASELPAVLGSGARLPLSSLGLDSDELAAVWLTAEGYVVGLPDGSTQRLQGHRVALTAGMSGTSAVLNMGGDTQVVTLTAAYRPLVNPRTNPDRLSST